jgi:hypothetical protein
VVFTLPHQLAPLAFHNKKTIYDQLFRASAATLLEIAADPKHLGAETGFLSVLHTWGPEYPAPSARPLRRSCGRSFSRP